MNNQTQKVNTEIREIKISLFRNPKTGMLESGYSAPRLTNILKGRFKLWQ